MISENHKEKENEGEDPKVLSQSWDWHVRRKMAWNPDTPEEILSDLARDKVQWVKEAVAGNAHASHSTLARLAEDSSGYVRAAVAMNSQATSEMLEMHDEKQLDSLLEEVYGFTCYRIEI